MDRVSVADSNYRQFMLNRMFPVVLALVTSFARAADKPVDFSREIMPILSDKCFACHGPDTKKKNELRLDSPAAATADRGGYRAVDPNEPEKS